MYNTGMSKGISKFQLALTEKKARRVEVAIIQGMVQKPKEYDDMSTMQQTLWVIEALGKVGSYCDNRIKELDLEILDIEGRIPRERI